MFWSETGQCKVKLIEYFNKKNIYTHFKDLLVDAQLRSDQHRQNYAALKTQHEGILHQLKVMEAEVTRLEADKQELQAELGWAADRLMWDQ